MTKFENFTDDNKLVKIHGKLREIHGRSPISRKMSWPRDSYGDVADS